MGYNREFGSLEQEIKQYLEPGPMGNKSEKGNRTDYQFDVHIRGNQKQRQVKTNSEQGIRVNNQSYPYGNTDHIRFREK